MVIKAISIGSHEVKLIWIIIVKKGRVIKAGVIIIIRVVKKASTTKSSKAIIIRIIAVIIEKVRVSSGIIRVITIVVVGNIYTICLVTRIFFY